MPLLRDADARADVVAYPVPSITGAHAGKDIKTSLKPVIPALRDFNGFMHRVVRGPDPVHEGLFTLSSKVGMEFNHRATRFNCIRAVNLDLVVVLSAQRERTQKHRPRNNEQSCFHYHQKLT
jgi:hypothetical protein